MKHIAIFIFFIGLSAAIEGVEFKDARIQWVPESAKNTAAFVTVINKSGQGKKIIRAESNRASIVELHGHAMSGGMLRMRPVPSIDVLANDTTELKSDGFHIMLIGLKRALREGDSVPITIIFEDGEKSTVNFTVSSGGSGDSSSSVDHSQCSNHNIADMIAPAGVMGAHMHTVGTWMLDYRVMLMEMGTNMDGNRKISPYEILYGVYYRPTTQMPMTGVAPPSPSLPRAETNENPHRYMMVGRDMTMEMRMFMPMYQYSENTMIMFMIPYNMNYMTMVANNFEEGGMRTKGVGDVSVSATFRIWQRGGLTGFLGTGLSIPTGSIDEKDWMPQMGEAKAGYQMQLGVGTYAFLGQAAMTGRMSSVPVSWGVQFDAIARSGKNENNYRAGNRYSGTAWGSLRLADWISFSVRVQKHLWENYIGQDPDLDPTMDPGNDPNRQGGNRTEIYGGFNLVATEGAFAGLRFFFETGKPVSQHVNGPQMAITWTTHFGIQYAL